MNKRLLITICLACTAILASAQQTWKFHPSFMAGTSAGQLHPYGQLKAFFALTKGPWSVGPGVAIDYYRYRTVPVFLSGTRDLSSPNSPTVLFLYGEAGINYPWYYPDINRYDYNTYDYQPASWFSAGPGLRFRLSRNHPQAIVLTAGYTHKNVKEVQTSGQYCDPAACPMFTNRYAYTYINNVLTFAIGLRF